MSTPPKLHKEPRTVLEIDENWIVESLWRLERYVEESFRKPGGRLAPLEIPCGGPRGRRGDVLYGWLEELASGEVPEEFGDVSLNVARKRLGPLCDYGSFIASLRLSWEMRRSLPGREIQGLCTALAQALGLLAAIEPQEVIRGRLNMDATSEGGRKSAARNKQRNAEIFRRAEPLLKRGLSKREIGRRLESEFDIGEDQIRRILREK